MPQQNQTQLGKYLRDYRVGEKLTQTEIERKLGIKTKGGYISRLESGAIQRPEDDILRKMADLMNLPFEDLQAMCRPADQDADKSVLRMACGYSLWNAPIRCAVGGVGLSGLLVSSFYKVKGEGTIEPEDIGTDDLEWMTRLSDRPTQPEPGTRLVPLSAADVAALLDKRRVEIGAMPGNLIRETALDKKLICIGTIVDSEVGCHFVFPKNSKIPDVDFLSTQELGNYLRERADKTQNEPMIRVGVEEGTVAAEFLDQAFGGDTLRHEIAWDCRASKMGEKSFADLKAECKQEYNAELVGVLVWEPIATWLKSRSMGKGQPELRNIAMNFVPARSPSKRPRLTYEVVISRSRIAEPAPMKKSLYCALENIMNACADSAETLNAIEKAPSTLVRRLADFYRFSKAGAGPDDVGDAMKSTVNAIATVSYSVRWNVVPELGIGPRS